MPAALLDTNAVSDLMRAHPRLTTRTGQHADAITTSVVAVGEIHYGLERLPAGQRRADLEARAHNILSSLSIGPVTHQIAEEYGRLKATLEGRGLNFDDNDLWIAAAALTDEALLITR